MTMDIHTGAAPIHVPPSVAPGASLSILDTLNQILAELKQANFGLQERPARAQLDLSPDAANTPNGRIVTGPYRLRAEQLVILAISAITFTLKIGESSKINFPAIVSGTTVWSVPVALVVERGQSLQLTATAATWAAWIIGETE